MSRPRFVDWTTAQRRAFLVRIVAGTGSRLASERTWRRWRRKARAQAEPYASFVAALNHLARTAWTEEAE